GRPPLSGRAEPPSRLLTTWLPRPGSGRCFRITFAISLRTMTSSGNGSGGSKRAGLFTRLSQSGRVEAQNPLPPSLPSWPWRPVRALGAGRARRYGLYVSMTQQQADDHVQNVASMLESDAVAAAYPDLGNRMIGKFGNPRGWRRNRLRTERGFTIDAIGLDTA